MTTPTLSTHVAPGTRRFLPYLALVFAVCALGFSAIFTRWANVPGAAAGFYRMLIAATVMALPAAANARRRTPLSWRHVGLAALAGLFFTGDIASWNTAVLIAPAANVTLLGNTSAIWAGIGGYVLFRERLQPRFWAGLALALAGVTGLVGNDFLTHPTLGTGDLLGLSSGFFFGLFFMATERARDRLSSLVCWWVSAAASVVGLLLLALALGQPLSGYSLYSYLNLAAVALVTQVGGYLALNYALGHLPASRVAPSVLGQPVLTALLAVPLLGQPLAPAQVAAGVVVLAGIWLVHSPR